MKPFALFHAFAKRLRPIKPPDRPAPSVPAAPPGDAPAWIYFVPTWMGTQLLPFPLVLIVPKMPVDPDQKEK